MRNNLKKNFLFSVIAVSGFFVLAEFLLRLIPFRPPIEMVKESGRQGSQVIYQLKDGQKVITPRPDGIFRIVVMGSSAAHGTPFIGAGFPEQLQALLELTLPEKRFEVVNFATEGISTMVGKEYLRQTLLLKPDLILLYMGNNEQLTYNWVNPYSHPVIFRAWMFFFLHSRMAQTVFVAQGKILQAGLVPMMVSKYFESEGQGPRMWPLERKIACRNAWVFNLEQMQKQAAKEKVPLIMSTLSANRSQFPPIRSLHSPGLSDDLTRQVDARLARVWEMLERNEMEKAQAEASQIIALDPEYALSWFYLGTAQERLGALAEAKASFEKALELSDFQQETTWADNEALRENCRKQNLVCLDLNSHFDRISQTGIAGWDLFMDYCHFNLEGSYSAAVFFYENLGRLGYWQAREHAEIPTLGQTLDHLQFGSAAEGMVYFNYGLALGHFFSRRELYQQSIYCLQKAVELNAFPGLALVHQALIRLKMGDAQGAEAALARAKNDFPAQFQRAVAEKLAGVISLENDYVAVKIKGVDWKSLYLRTGAKSSKTRPLSLAQADYYFQWNGAEQSFRDITAAVKNRLAELTNKASSPLFLWGKNNFKFSLANDLKPSSQNGSFEAFGNDPYLVFDLAGMKSAAVKDLRIDFKLKGPVKPALELYWKGPNESFQESKKLALECKRCSCRISLRDHPAWLLSGPVSQLRLDFPPGTKSLRLKSVALDVIKE